MAPKASTMSSRRLASTIALATTAFVAGNAAMRDQRADACGWSGPEIEDLTTFDPAVTGVDEITWAKNRRVELEYTAGTP